jgi:hypothetical protein
MFCWGTAYGAARARTGSGLIGRGWIGPGTGWTEYCGCWVLPKLCGGKALTNFDEYVYRIYDMK